MTRWRFSTTIVNLLIATAITLVVNFSYLMLFIIEPRFDTPQRPFIDRAEELASAGRLVVTPDGHGYITFPSRDSVYVPMSRIRRMELSDGDSLLVSVTQPKRRGAHCMMADIVERNGLKVEGAAMFNRPSASVEMVYQLLYYLVLSFVILSILTLGLKPNYSMRTYLKRCAWCVVVAVVLYFMAPVTKRHSGAIVMNFMTGRLFDNLILLKCSFAVAVAMLYGRIYVLLYQQQAMAVENEQLKNENLKTRYNMLMSQINPHFFFNSLNSLAMLVREKDDAKALTYIDQLSYTFRYIIQNGQCSSTTLADEIKFAEAYSYLFRIRYADKLFFDVDVDPTYNNWTLPAMSLQPLIGNAVKHNTITRSNPLHVSIRTEGEWLVVSNPKRPKIEPEPSTGIGLDNLRSRWLLTTGCNIEIIDTDDTFTVRLPLQKPTFRCE